MPKRYLMATLALMLLLAACGTPREEIRPTPISAGGGEGGGSADEGGGVGQTVNLRLWTPQNDAHNAADQTLIAAYTCLLYTSPSPRDRTRSRMPSSA